MPSRAAAIFAAYAPALASHLAEQVLACAYTPPGESAVAVPAVILGAEKHEELETDDGRKQHITREATVLRTPGGPFETEPPALNAPFSVGPTEYSIEAVLFWTDNLATLRLARRPVMEAAKPGYRRKT